MTGCTYLQRSRHGVYYRMVLPKAMGHAWGRPRRELKVSLRTKDKSRAKSLMSRISCMANGYFHSVYAEGPRSARFQLYRRCWEMIQRHNLPLDDEVELLLMSSTCHPQDLSVFLFAWDQLAKKRSGGSPLQADADVQQQDLRPLRQTDNPNDSVSAADALNHFLDEQRSRGSPLRAGAFAEPATPRQGHQQISPTNTVTATIALERFIEGKKRETASGTAEKYASQCHLFLALVSNNRNDLRMDQIAIEDLRRYVDALPKLPRKLLPKSRRLPLVASPSERMSAQTVFSHARAVHMFLSWCADQQYPVPNGFGGILKPLIKKPKASKKRKHFTEDELRTIFGADEYRNGTFKRPSDYWLPLLALFTGARESELCQLRAADVREESPGLWCIDIHDLGQNRVKTATSVRIVPLHATLLRLGFTEYVRTLSQVSTTPLFPHEERNGRGEFGAFSKRFNRFKEGLGIKSDQDLKLDFHSFRHTMQHDLYGKGCEEYVVNAICGHGNGGRMGVHTYSRGPGLTAMRETLSLLDFNEILGSTKSNGWFSPG